MRHIVFTSVLLAAILGVYLLMAARYPVAYLLGTYEDLFGEWLQFYLFAAALILSVRIVLSPSPYRWFFALLALACFYVTMEEISWGQRIFGWSTPAFLKARNLQGETNIHNLFVGPVRTGAKSFAEIFLAAVFLMYGVGYPAAVRGGLKAAVWLEGKGLAAPPLYLWPYFTAASVLELGLFRFNEAEVAEIVIALALVIMTAHYIHSPPGGAGAAVGGTPPGSSRRMTQALGWTIAAAAVLSALTTGAIYSSPDGRAKIDNRIVNGIEKFARRYTRYERWDSAAALYGRLLEIDPGRPSVMRRLATIHLRTGKAGESERRLREALEYDLERYRKNPDGAAVNRSLCRTYRQMGEEEKAREHLQMALQSALERVEKHPGSARAAYSLARTHQLGGSSALALRQFRRAFELKPTSQKYRKDYMAAVRRQKKTRDQEEVP